MWWWNDNPNGGKLSFGGKIKRKEENIKPDMNGENKAEVSTIVKEELYITIDPTKKKSKNKIIPIDKYNKMD